MPNIAITTYIPHLLNPWPASGHVEWSTISQAIPKQIDTKFLSLPCQHPGHLHWQGNWVVLEIEGADYQVSDGFVAFQRGTVLFNGPAKEALVYLRQHNIPAPHSLDPVKIGLDFEDVTLGDNSIAIAGWDATATVGKHALAFGENYIAIAGDHGVAISNYGSATAGDFGCAWTEYGHKAKAGYRGIARTYECGCSEVGGVGVATTDDFGTAICGHSGVALAGMCGVAIAGEHGLAFARQDGKVMAGERGVLLLVHFDEIKVPKVGENGIKPMTPYQMDEFGNFVECGLHTDEPLELDSFEIQP